MCGTLNKSSIEPSYFLLDGIRQTSERRTEPSGEPWETNLGYYRYETRRLSNCSSSTGPLIFPTHLIQSADFTHEIPITPDSPRIVSFTARGTTHPIKHPSRPFFYPSLRSLASSFASCGALCTRYFYVLGLNYNPRTRDTV